MKKVLVLAPHTDDGELGCGGTLAKLIDNGDEIFYMAFSTCQESVPKGMPEGILRDELGMSMQSFGIKKENVFVFNYKVRHFAEKRQDILDDMIRVKKLIMPNIVFCPSPHDIHQDHNTISNEALRAFKNESILGYELPWNNYTFDNQAFSVLDDQHIIKKIAALKNYESQKERIYFQNDYIKGLAMAHGVQIGQKFAEVFEVIRWII